MVLTKLKATGLAGGFIFLWKELDLRMSLISKYSFLQFSDCTNPMLFPRIRPCLQGRALFSF